MVADDGVEVMRFVVFVSRCGNVTNAWSRSSWWPKMESRWCAPWFFATRYRIIMHLMHGLDVQGSR